MSELEGSVKGSGFLAPTERVPPPRPLLPPGVFTAVTQAVQAATATPTPASIAARESIEDRTSRLFREARAAREARQASPARKMQKRDIILLSTVLGVLAGGSVGLVKNKNAIETSILAFSGASSLILGSALCRSKSNATKIASIVTMLLVGKVAHMAYKG